MTRRNEKRAFRGSGVKGEKKNQRAGGPD